MHAHLSFFLSFLLFLSFLSFLMALDLSSLSVFFFFLGGIVMSVFLLFSMISSPSKDEQLSEDESVKSIISSMVSSSLSFTRPGWPLGALAANYEASLL